MPVISALDQHPYYTLHNVANLLKKTCMETCNQQLGRHWHSLFKDCDRNRSDYGRFVGICGEEYCNRMRMPACSCAFGDAGPDGAANPLRRTTRVRTRLD